MFTNLLRAAVAASLIAAPAVAEVSPETVDGATTVTVEEAAALFDQGVPFIDTRKAADFDAGRIPGAVNLDVSTDFTEANLAAVVAKDAPVVVYCNGHSCMRSSEAAALAVSWGYGAVSYLRDGFPAWESAGMPVE